VILLVYAEIDPEYFTNRASFSQLQTFACLYKLSISVCSFQFSKENDMIDYISDLILSSSKLNIVQMNIVSGAFPFTIV